jgi:hypothetical protein
MQAEKDTEETPYVSPIKPTSKYSPGSTISADRLETKQMRQVIREDGIVAPPVRKQWTFGGRYFRTRKDARKVFPGCMPRLVEVPLGK